MDGPADPKAVLGPFFGRDDIRVPVGRLKASLPAGAELWVIGGAPRNALIEAVHGESPLTEDIDLFITGVDPGLDLSSLDLQGRLHSTELEGVRWFPPDSGFSFDVGLLARFLLIEKFRLPPTPNSLLGAIDFDVNAVMWHWESQRVMTAGWVQAIARKVMDFNTTLVFDKVLLAYRILLTRHKIGFGLSKNIFAYLRRTLDLERSQSLKAMLVSKQGKRMADDVMADCDTICCCSSHEEYCALLTCRKPG